MVWCYPRTTIEDGDDDGYGGKNEVDADGSVDALQDDLHERMGLPGTRFWLFACQTPYRRLARKLKPLKFARQAWSSRGIGLYSEAAAASGYPQRYANKDRPILRCPREAERWGT